MSDQRNPQPEPQCPADVGVKTLASQLWSYYHKIMKREPQMPAAPQRLESGPGGAMLPVRTSEHDTSETSILPGPVTYVSMLTKLPVRKENT